RCRRINERRFVRRRARLDGRPVEYLLHDQPVTFLKGKLRLRQVTRLCEGGHQTNVITSRWDLRDIEVAYRMFERWRQENFFKYMREEFLLDARSPRAQRTGCGQARHGTQTPDRHHQDGCLSGRERAHWAAAASLRPYRSRGANPAA